MRVRADRKVRQRDPGATQVLAEVAHRREEQRDPCLVAPDVRRLFRRLDDQHPVARAVEPHEHGTAAVELVAEDEDERAAARAAAEPCLSQSAAAGQ